MFPKTQGKRRVHPREFHMALMQLRTMFWNHRRTVSDADDHVYVRERVPLGSQFNHTGGYLTPEGYYISKQMRDRVIILNQRYKEIEAIQNQWHDQEITDTQMKQECTTHMQQWAIPPLIPPGGPQP
ncbi:hypothetical protein LTR49_028806, partial [Elasticomyces elasticus]